MADLFRLLHANGAEVILGGHDHGYQRFAPATADGVADPETGVREFVVGSGGATAYAFPFTSTLLEVRDNTSFGVLRLDLAPGGYAWQFLPAGPGTFTDSGTGTCH